MVALEQVYLVSLLLLKATCSKDGTVRIYEAPDIMNLSQWQLQVSVTWHGIFWWFDPFTHFTDCHCHNDPSYIVVALFLSMRSSASWVAAVYHGTHQGTTPHTWTIFPVILPIYSPQCHFLKADSPICSYIMPFHTCVIIPFHTCVIIPFHTCVIFLLYYRVHASMLAVGSDDANPSAGGKVQIHEYVDSARWVYCTTPHRFWDWQPRHFISTCLWLLTELWAGIVQFSQWSNEAWQSSTVLARQASSW